MKHALNIAPHALALVLVAVLAFPHGAFAATIVNRTITSNVSLTSGLVGHWTFDAPNLIQNVTDSSGQGNNGALSGFTSTTTALGKVGQALRFDGVNDRIDMGSPVSLEPSSVTFSMWINPDTFPSSWVFVGGMSGNSWNDGYYFAAQSTNGIQFSINAYGSGGSVILPVSATPQGQWTHLVGTYDGATIKLYVNGAFYDQTVYSTAIDYTGVDFRLAQHAGALTNYKGKMDDVRVYNRVLSEAEVKRLYGLGATSYVSKTIRSTSNTTGLVGHWTFDGTKMLQNVGDSSGSGNNGALSGFAATSTVLTIGKVGQALKFDGVDSYIDVANYSSTITGSFTVCAWAYWNTVSGLQKIVHAQNGTPEVNLDNYTAGANPKIHFYTAAAGSSNNSIFTDDDVQANRWYHVCGVYNDSGTRTKFLYVNGALEGSGATAVKIAWPSSALRIGRRLTNIEPLNGKLDDVRVYSRALSADEIKHLYGLGSTSYVSKTISAPTSPLVNGLVGHWTFDGPKLVQNVTDSSGQGNNGKLTGFTSTTTAIGVLGQALKFDGSNDYVTVPNSAPLTPTTITASAWVRPATTPQGAYATIVNHRYVTDAIPYNSWIIDTSAAGNTYEWCVTNAAGGGPDLGQWCLSGGALSTMWTHVVGTYDGTTQSLYVNGVLANSEVISISLDTTSTQPVRIGSANGIEGFFNGSIDDARVYNRALTAGEVLKLYQAGQ